MNLAYIIDLDDILKEDDMYIPQLDGMHYSHMEPNDLGVTKIIEMRDAVMYRTRGVVDKHLFFFVIKNNKDTLNKLSECVNAIQNDKDNFNNTRYGIHVVCNFVEEEGFGIVEYETSMPSLKRNDVCVYSWFLDKYDSNGDRPIGIMRRSRAIVRLVWMVSNHDEINRALRHVSGDLDLPKPIYNLFGDATLFFDAEMRLKQVNDYYCFKNLQHLLNLPDNEIEKYLNEKVRPLKDQDKELDKVVDATAESFLKENRVPIEASSITEKTQGLLIKSSDDDDEYLVNTSDNKLVFINDMAKNSGWQLEDMPVFLSGFQSRVGRESETQEIVSDQFVKELHDKVVTHERSVFDNVNNIMSDTQRAHVERFKHQVDGHLRYFLNQYENKSNYSKLQEVLTVQETKYHHANIDYGIAFMEYLESGKGDYLVDQAVSMGDTNLKVITEAVVKEEVRCREEYKAKVQEFEDNYKLHGSEPAKIKEKFSLIDENIKKCRTNKLKCDFQLDHWVDGDANKHKLTARTRSVIAFGCGVFASLLWLFVSSKYLKELFEEPSDFGRIQWALFSVFVLIGIIYAGVVLFKASRRRKEAEKALDAARNQKRRLMDACVNDMKDLVESHYNYLLAFHGLKMMEELSNFVAWKKEDLVKFRKTVFKLMLKYRLAVDGTNKTKEDDGNTIEVTDKDAKSILFGSDEQKMNVDYVFAQGVALSETFDDFKRKKAKLETSRSGLSHYSQGAFDKEALEKEVIECREEDQGMGMEYSFLNLPSVLPSTEGVVMDDIDQGRCGDCYFMATLAAIANTNPEYIIGDQGMVEELGDDHRFFRVKFYDKDGQRVNIDVDNRFWNINNTPCYAGVGKTENAECYDPWVMAVEKAWAKANNDGYDGIEGASADGKERVRRVEYSFAVTGKSAFYCQTQNVDSANLLQQMKKHLNDCHLPITLYSASSNDTNFSYRDDTVVDNHAYALRSINDDGTFDIFNPWNSHSANENVRGKHYEHVTIDFVKNNFDVVVFFGIKESEFDSFERELTANASDDEVTKHLQEILKKGFNGINLNLRRFEDLITEDDMKETLNNSTYLFSSNKIADAKGREGRSNLMYLEGGKTGVCDDANEKMTEFVRTNLSADYSFQEVLRCNDDKQCLTLFRLSPQYVLGNFK